MTTQIRDVIEFVKRHRGKLVVGASVLGSVYVAKKVAESEALTTLFHSAAQGFQDQENEISTGSNINQARKNFLFDAHQQSCDKVVQQVVAQIQLDIQQRFDAEAIVQLLKKGEIDAKEKIKLWEDLKIKVFGRILAVAYCYPLLVVAFKVQKSILCQETCRAMQQTTQHTSTYDEMYNYVSSFFWNTKLEKKENCCANPQTQQLFSNCIFFLTTEGIKELCNRINRVTSEVFGGVSLAAEIDSSKLFKRAIQRMEEMTGNQNFSEFVVPCSGPVISTLANKSSHLQDLLKQLLNSLQSQMCKTLFSYFVKLYVDETLNVLNAVEHASLPLAKLIPVASEIFYQITSTHADTPFHKMLISSELYQFSHLVFDISSAEEAFNLV